MTIDERPFVCPWCGASFRTRYVSELGRGPSLEDHWRTNPECSANRNVNNPTAEKDLEPAAPRLRLVDDNDGEP